MRGCDATMARATDASLALVLCNLSCLPLPPKGVGTCVFAVDVLEDGRGTKACADRAPAARYAVAVARPEVRLRVLLREFIPMFVSLLTREEHGMASKVGTSHHCSVLCSRWWFVQHVTGNRVSPAVGGRTKFSGNWESKQRQPSAMAATKLSAAAAADYSERREALHRLDR